jgi:hypothetical protein
MPFSIRSSHRYPVPCAVTHNAGPFDKVQSEISHAPCGGSQEIST